MVYTKLKCFMLVMLWICSTTAGLTLSHASSSKFGGRVNVFVTCKSNNSSKICHYYSNENEEKLPDALIEQYRAEQFYEEMFTNRILEEVQFQSNNILPELGGVRSVDMFR